MNTQTITLTPPIDGVQYGYLETELDNTKPVVNISTDRFSSMAVLRNPVFSTNPKDTRFPFLVMPSKEQEVYQQLEEIAIKYFTPTAEQQKEIEEGILFIDLGREDNLIQDAKEYHYRQGLKHGFNANKGIYTQEQLLEFTKWVDDNEIPYEGGNWIKYFDGRDNYLNTTELFEIYLQSLQPTAKAVVVEMEENNCDGCKAGIPVDEYNYHRMGKGIYPDFMICQKDKYNKIKVEKSTEYSQGIVKAIEVI